MSTPSPNPTPQFTTAEYAGVAGTEHCQFCRNQIGSHYYRVNERMACEACGQRAQLELPKDSHSQYARGLIFGIGAAIIGLILYATFEVVTGWIIGYVSLAVGYIVGKGIKMGSRGAGGRKYQITAVALTYAAVALAAVPVYISTVTKSGHTRQESQNQRQTADPNQQTAKAGHQEPWPSRNGSTMGLGAALAVLVGIGLASPFLELAGDPIQGFIGLVILAVGVRIAWRLAAGTETQIYGPFENGTAATANLT